MDKSQYMEPREYEMMVVLLPDQAEGETQAATEAVLGYITDQKGTITSANAESPWGRRRLAYTVRHEGVDYRDGHYVLVYFNALPSAIGDIERELKLDVNVIRYLLLTYDAQMGEKIDESQVEAEEGDDEAASEEAVAVSETPAVEAAEAPAEQDVAESPAPAGETIEAPAAEVDEAPSEETAEEVAEIPAEDAAEATQEGDDVAAEDDAAAEAEGADEAAADEATEDDAADEEVQINEPVSQ